MSAFVDFTGETAVFSFSKNGEDQVNINLSNFLIFLWVGILYITIYELDPQPY